MTDGRTERQPGRPAEASQSPHLPLRDLLAAVASARQTRLQLVCRELEIEESRVRPAWDLALRGQLVEPVAIDANTGDAMYRLRPGRGGYASPGRGAGAPRTTRRA